MLFLRLAVISLLLFSPLVSAEDICQKILAERVELPDEVWLPTYHDFMAKVRKVSKPVGHGLTSYEFRQVLKTGGLQAGQMEGAWGPEVISLSDLDQPDGFLASIGFANRNDMSTYAVYAEPYTGRDIVDRFVSVNLAMQQAGRLKRWLMRTLLRAIALRFANERPMGESEYPVYLVLDRTGLDVRYVRPELVPSELETKDVVPLSLLRYALVPAGSVEVFSSLLSEAGVNGVEVFPLELVELYEIKKNRSWVRSRIRSITRWLAGPLYRWLSKKMKREDSHQ